MTLISSPAKAWEEIRLVEDKRKVHTDFVYPMIGLCALSVFLGSLFTHGWGGPQSFQIAMTECCVVAVSLFAGYFLAAYAVNEVSVQMFDMPNNMPAAQQFAGYSLVVTFLVYIVSGILPAFAFIGIILQFYIIYIVWEGAPILMDVKEDVRLKYTIIVSVLLILCPVIIQFTFKKLLFFFN